VTVVQYADVECPDCRRLEPVLRQLVAQHDGVRMVYRHFPLVDVHPYAYSAALALEAAGESGRFWELHDLLFAAEATFGRRALSEYGEQLGLAAGALLRPATERFDDKVRSDFHSGVASGVEGTPALFVDGVRFRGRPTRDRLVRAVRREPA
jgi:protein-disulfide isomerase